MRNDPGALVAALLLVQNLQPATVLAGIGPAWSLAVEMVFYLAVPVLAWGAWRFRPRDATTRRALALAVAPAGVLLLVGLATNAIMAVVWSGPSPGGWNQTWYSVVARSFFAHAALFAPGMALAVVAASMSLRGAVLPRRAASGLLLGAVVMTAGSAGMYQLDLVPRSLYDLGMAVGCTALIAAVGLPLSGGLWWLTSLLDMRAIAAVGVASYSVYLWHEPFIRWMAARDLTSPGAPAFWRNLVLVAVVTAVLSTATYLAVERPAMRYAARKRDAEASTPAGGPAGRVGGQPTDSPERGPVRAPASKRQR